MPKIDTLILHVKSPDTFHRCVHISSLSRAVSRRHEAMSQFNREECPGESIMLMEGCQRPANGRTQRCGQALGAIGPGSETSWRVCGRRAIPRLGYALAGCLIR